MTLPKQQLRELEIAANAVTLKRANLNLITNDKECPWLIREIQNILKRLDNNNDLLLPNLLDENESIAIFSDYGGESSESKYYTYTFLVCGWSQLYYFNEHMTKIRKEHGMLSPFKEIAFKDFHYGPIKRILPEYLRGLNGLVNGLLFTVAIEKSVQTVFGENTKSTKLFAQETLKNHNFGEWKPDIAEKLLRIIHISAYLIALLSGPNKKIFWMTDHDSIAQGSEKFTNTLNLFGRILQYYCPHELSTIGGAVPFDERNSYTLDPLSACDIVAGSIEHYLTRKETSPTDLLIRNEANGVLEWLSNNGLGLKKLNIIINKNDTGITIGSLQFKLVNEPQGITYVPIILSSYQSSFSPDT